MAAVEFPPGLSVWEQSLYRHIHEHVTTESTLIEEYERLAEESGSAHVAYLLRLIADDEARHHRIWQEWAASLRAFVEDTDEPRVPDVQRERHPRDLADRVERLMAFERDDAKELKALRKELKDVRDVTLWSLLVELMQLDTEKHLRILEFLRDHARATARHQGDDLER
jgi:rubrerythrin